MRLTVCICTHNRPADVRDCLAGLRRQTAGHGSHTVLLVDSGSSSDAAARLRQLAAAHPGTRLIRLEQPGLSAARNAGAQAADTSYIAYIDDDAIPAPDWVACILAALRATKPPIMLGGRILPRWRVPLPEWWPPTLRGVLSLIEVEGTGEIGSPALPPSLEPYGANLVVHVPTLLTLGGFACASGRTGNSLLSDEEVRLARRLRAAGHAVQYDSRIVVEHQIPAERLTVRWLLSRLYWQGVSTVLTRRALRQSGTIWREVPRRLAAAILFAPTALLPRDSPRLIGCRWRLAYAAGFIRAALTSRQSAPPVRAAPPG